MANAASDNRKLTIRLATLGLLCAIGIVLSIVTKFPLLGPIKYDAADVPIFIGTMYYGPLSGVIMTVIVSAIQSFTVGTSGITGFIMHVFATGAACVALGLTYREVSGDGDYMAAIGDSTAEITARPRVFRAFGLVSDVMVYRVSQILPKIRLRRGLALGLGTLVMTALMIPLNLVVMPLFLNIPVTSVVKMIVPTIIPANLIKAGVNSALAFALIEAVNVSRSAMRRRAEK